MRGIHYVSRRLLPVSDWGKKRDVMPHVKYWALCKTRVCSAYGLLCAIYAIAMWCISVCTSKCDELNATIGEQIGPCLVELRSCERVPYNTSKCESPSAISVCFLSG